MVRRVVWSHRALADVDAIASYIAANSSSYARTVVRKILTSTRALATFPFSGRMVPEADDENLREVFAYSFRVILSDRAGCSPGRCRDSRQAHAVANGDVEPSSVERLSTVISRRKQQLRRDAATNRSRMFWVAADSNDILLTAIERLGLQSLGSHKAYIGGSFHCRLKPKA